MFPTQEMLDESYKSLTEGEKSFLPQDGFKILVIKIFTNFYSNFNMGIRHSTLLRRISFKFLVDE